MADISKAKKLLKNRLGQFCSSPEEVWEPDPPGKYRVAIAVQWDGVNKEEIKAYYPFYYFFIGKRPTGKKKELVACVGDTENRDDWVFKGDWILLLDNDDVKILTNVFYQRGLKNGEVVLT